MKKNLRQLIVLSSAGLLLSVAAPIHQIVAQEETDEETTEMVETEETVEGEDTEEAAEAEEDYAFEVEADVINSEEEVLGTAHFTEDQDGKVELHLQLSGLEEGEYGMHIHEVGLATAPTFEDAGSHFNPTDVEHGTETESGPHLGDLPNLVVDETGEVDEVFELHEDVTLDPEGENTLNSTDGTTLIIHTAADDYESQPTGDAGERQAAAVIFAPLEDSEYYQSDEDTEEVDTEEETDAEEVDTEEETTEEEAE